MAKKPEAQGIKIGERFEVKRKEILIKLLIEKRESILFVGEGNFTFAVAFAALRKATKPCEDSADEDSDTWDDITATCYESNRPKFKDAVKVCKEECDSDDEKKILRKLEKPPSCSWKCDVDAYHLVQSFPSETFSVIWFQCPYVGKEDKTWNLIQYFLLSASHRVESGGLVCVGITRHEDYLPHYQLEKLITLPYTNNIEDIHKRYKNPFADITLVKEVLSYGYKHQSYLHDQGIDIHETIKDCHVTLVFERKSTPPYF